MSGLSKANGAGVATCERAGQGADPVGLLVFRIDGREHAIAVGQVVEVVRMVAATPLPDAPAWVLGLIDFRGRVIPLIDLRTRLGAPSREPDLATPIVVVATDRLAAGVVVDEVVEVLALHGDSFEEPGRLAADSPAIAAVAGHRGRLILVLALESICDGGLAHRSWTREAAS